MKALNPCSEFDLDRHTIRDWYNGYNWLGEGVYNPFDILQLFDKRDFRAYWFETGTPTFLIDQLMQRQIVSLKLDSLVSSAAMLSSFDVDDMTIEALLFQTGYLTIKQRENLGSDYKAYADKYRMLNQPIHLIGVEFSKDSRNIVGFDREQAS